MFLPVGVFIYMAFSKFGKARGLQKAPIRNMVYRYIQNSESTPRRILDRIYIYIYICIFIRACVDMCIYKYLIQYIFTYQPNTQPMKMNMNTNLKHQNDISNHLYKL